MAPNANDGMQWCDVPRPELFSGGQCIKREQSSSNLSVDSGCFSDYPSSEASSQALSEDGSEDFSAERASCDGASNDGYKDEESRESFSDEGLSNGSAASSEDFDFHPSIKPSPNFSGQGSTSSWVDKNSSVPKEVSTGFSAYFQTNDGKTSLQHRNNRAITKSTPYKRVSNHQSLGETKASSRNEKRDRPTDEKASPPASKEEARTAHEALLKYIGRIMAVGDYKECQCFEDAQKLFNLVLTYTKSQQLSGLLLVFGHSYACQEAACVKLCRVIRCLRNHVSSADHPCALMPLYANLVRLHVDACELQDCGFGSCKSIRVMRKVSNQRTIGPEVKQLEESIRHVLKEVDNKSTQDVQPSANDCWEDNKEGGALVIDESAMQEPTEDPSEEGSVIDLSVPKLKKFSGLSNSLVSVRG